MPSYPPVVVRGPAGSSSDFPFVYSPGVVFPTDADYTMTYPDMSGSSGFLLVTSSVSLTATRKMIAPLTVGFMWAVENATTGGHAIQVIGATGTGVTIPSGYTMPVYCDGTNYVTNPAASGGTVLGVTGTAPVASTGGTNPIISMAQANGSTDGFLTQADWTTFNGKQAALGFTPAHSGANSDITSLSGMTTPLPASEGGTGGGGGTGYAYGNGSAPFTYSPTIPTSSISGAGVATSANVSLGSGAGTSPILVSVLGKDTAFIVNFITGSSPSTVATIFIYIFTIPRTGNSYPTFTIYSSGSQIFSSLGQIPYMPPASGTGIALISGPTALTAATEYNVVVNCPPN